MKQRMAFTAIGMGGLAVAINADGIVKILAKVFTNPNVYPASVTGNMKFDKYIKLKLEPTPNLRQNTKYSRAWL